MAQYRKAQRSGMAIPFVMITPLHGRHHLSRAQREYGFYMGLAQ